MLDILYPIAAFRGEQMPARSHTDGPPAIVRPGPKWEHDEEVQAASQIHSLPGSQQGDALCLSLPDFTFFEDRGLGAGLRGSAPVSEGKYRPARLCAGLLGDRTIRSMC